MKRKKKGTPRLKKEYRLALNKDDTFANKRHGFSRAQLNEITRKESKKGIHATQEMIIFPNPHGKCYIHYGRAKEILAMKPDKETYTRPQINYMHNLANRYYCNTSENRLVKTMIMNKIQETLPPTDLEVTNPDFAVTDPSMHIFLDKRVSLVDMAKDQKRFKTAEQFSDQALTYLDWCEKQKQWPSLAGLGNFLGFNIKTAPAHWKDDQPDVFMVYENFKQRLAEIYEQAVQDKKSNVVGVIFLMKNSLGYQDRIEQTIEHSGGMTINMIDFKDMQTITPIDIE